MKSHLDMSGLKALEKKLKDLERNQVEFGYPEGSGQHSDAKMPYAELATILEWGARNENGYTIPPRPAFRQTIQDLKTSHSEFESEVRPYFKAFLENKSQGPMPLVKASAGHVTGRYQYTMEFWYIEGNKNNRNAPLTTALKGHNMPYVDTGELIRNANYRIK